VRGARYRAGAVVLALVCAVPSVRAEAIAQLHDFLTHASSARGQFTQKDAAGKGGSPRLARGDFEFLRPGRFRWTYRSPYEQLIVSDGATLFLYDKDLNQVTRRKLSGALPASPASILFGSDALERDFELSAEGASGGLEWLRARPRQADSPFTDIRIGLRNGLPAAMELKDSFGQSTQLSFDKVERNPPLAAAAFAFVPPKGVDVLEEK
jgi:outer membrane lipoprotein carrier protein